MRKILLTLTCCAGLLASSAALACGPWGCGYVEPTYHTCGGGCCGHTCGYEPCDSCYPTTTYYYSGGCC